jgi:hypothetical protein
VADRALLVPLQIVLRIEFGHNACFKKTVAIGA